jgi:hypothetical protein
VAHAAFDAAPIAVLSEALKSNSPGPIELGLAATEVFKALKIQLCHQYLPYRVD